MKKTIATIAGAALAAILAGSAGAAPGAPEVKLGSFVDTLTIGGDLRLRYDEINYTRTWQGGVYRGRERYRLRVNLDWALTDMVTAKVRFATNMPQNDLKSGYSSLGNPTSANKTMGFLDDPFPLYIDRAYAVWQPMEEVTMMGGRMENPFWQPYSANIVWDSNVNPEGFAQKADTLVLGTVRVFANALQMPVTEQSSSTHDQWMMGEQAGFEVKLPLDTRLKMAGSFLDWTHIQQFPLNNTTQDGNLRAGTDSSNTGFSSGLLKQYFGVAVLDAELSGWVMNLPVSLQGTYVNNTRFASKRSRSDYIHGPEQWGGQAGAVLGKASTAGTWEVAYFYKYAREDCTVADLSDSDFGPSGGLNRQGNIVWVAYGLTDSVSLKATDYINTQVINRAFTASPNGKLLGKEVNRLLVDLQVKF
jgi:hypothetical protein